MLLYSFYKIIISAVIVGIIIILYPREERDKPFLGGRFAQRNNMLKIEFKKKLQFDLI